MAVSEDMRSKVTCSCDSCYRNNFCIEFFQFMDTEFAPSTRDTHANHIKDLNGQLASHISTTYGINFESVLNSSRYFHVTEGLVMDIMHDILEGTFSTS